MANNQITPFQLTDQFTMDNFNQRINETNTALQKKADGGFGYGDNKNSFYNNTEDDGTIGVAHLETVRSGMSFASTKRFSFIDKYTEKMLGTTRNTDCTLYFFSTANALAEFTSVTADNIFVRGFRSYNEGTWGPIELENPPMKLGVEYRTTERYQGKPVYAKVIEAGFNPAGMTKTTSDKTVSASGLVRFSAVRDAWSFPSFMYGGNYDDSGNIQVAVQAKSDGIHVFTLSKTRDMTSATVNVSVYYTKD